MSDMAKALREVWQPISVEYALRDGNLVRISHEEFLRLEKERRRNLTFLRNKRKRFSVA